MISRLCHAQNATHMGWSMRHGPHPTLKGINCSLNLSLRHEVARLIVWRVVRTRPAVPSAVSYEDVRRGHDPYRALGHGTHSLLTGACTVRERCLCQHQAEKGLAGWYGEHTCTLDKRRDEQQAQDAERLEPKRHWSGYRVSIISCHGHPTLPAEREHLTRPCQPGGTWEARIAPS